MYWRAPRLALVATWVIQILWNKYVYIRTRFSNSRCSKHHQLGGLCGTTSLHTHYRAGNPHEVSWVEKSLITMTSHLTGIFPLIHNGNGFVVNSDLRITFQSVLVDIALCKTQCDFHNISVCWMLALFVWSQTNWIHHSWLAAYLCGMPQRIEEEDWTSRDRHGL